MGWALLELIEPFVYYWDKVTGQGPSQELPDFQRYSRKVISILTNGVSIPSGSKILATVERTVWSVDIVVLGTLVVGCNKVVSSVVSHLTPRTRCTVAEIDFSPPSMEQMTS